MAVEVRHDDWLYRNILRGCNYSSMPYDRYWFSLSPLVSEAPGRMMMVSHGRYCSISFWSSGQAASPHKDLFWKQHTWLQHEVLLPAGGGIKKVNREYITLATVWVEKPLADFKGACHWETTLSYAFWWQDPWWHFLNTPHHYLPSV